MSRPVSVANDDLGPLHLASTPIAILAPYGLATYAGLSGDDPADTRNRNVTFSVVLSAFGGSRLIGRRELRTLGPHEHVFLSLDEELGKLGWRERATLCVVHRVPSPYLAGDEIRSGAVQTIPGDEALARVRRSLGR